MDAKIKNFDVIEGTEPFDFMGKTYHLKMSFWAEARFLATFGADLSRALSGGDALESIGKMLTILINQDIADHNDKFPDDQWTEFTPEYVMRHLPDGKTSELAQLVTDVMTKGRPKVDESEMTDDEKN